MTEHRHGSHCNGTHRSRREFLGGLVLTGAASILPVERARAQAAAVPGKGRIDVHYHIFPPETLAVSRNPAQKAWTVQQAIEELDRNGVATGIASAGSSLPVGQGACVQ